jgi:hypothetical protein
VADIPVGPEILLQLSQIKMRMSARDHQAPAQEIEDRHFRFAAAPPLLQQHGMNVSLKMIHGDQRLLQRKGQRLGIADANQQSARQSRPLRDRDGIDRLISLSRLGQAPAAPPEPSPASARARQVPEPLRHKAGAWRSARPPRSTESAAPNAPPPRPSRHRSFRCRGCRVRHNEVQAFEARSSWFAGLQHASLRRLTN